MDVVGPRRTDGAASIGKGKRALWALLLISLLIPLASEPAAGETVSSQAYTIPSTIDGTGTVDTTADLLAFFASVPDGTTGAPSVVSPPGPALKYRIDGTLALKNRNHMVFNGRGALFDGGQVAYPWGTPVPVAARTRSQWSFGRGSDIALRDMTIKGANPKAGISDAAYRASLEAQHGMQFVGVAGVEVAGVTVNDPYGDFVYLGPSVLPSFRLTSDVRIHDNRFERNGRQGIAFTGATDVTIERNYIAQVRRTIFDLEPNLTAGEVRRVTIRDNDIGPTRFAVFAANGNVNAPMSDIVMDGNRLLHQGLEGGIHAFGVRRGPFTFTNNSATTGPGEGVGNPVGGVLNFRRIDGVHVHGNTQQVQPNRNMYFVSVMYSCGVDISGNTVINGPECKTDAYEDSAAC
jgi:hypothetical protein